MVQNTMVPTLEELATLAKAANVTAWDRLHDAARALAFVAAFHSPLHPNYAPRCAEYREAFEAWSAANAAHLQAYARREAAERSVEEVRAELESWGMAKERAAFLAGPARESRELHRPTDVTERIEAAL